MIRRPPRSTRTAHAFPTRRSSDLDHADDAPRGAGEDRIAAVEGTGGGEAARAFHELRVDAVPELGDELIDIVAQDGREIGVGERCVAAADELDQRAEDRKSVV